MLMKLIKYLSNRRRGFKADFAKRLGISLSFLRQIETGAAKMPIAVAKHIESYTDGAVKKSDVRPDIWD